MTKKELELQKSWNDLLKRHSKPLERGAKAFKVDTRFMMNKKEQSNTEALLKIKSLVTPGGDATLPKTKKYTGTAMIGIATMHKSNLVPVFSKEQAEATASMRR